VIHKDEESGPEHDGETSDKIPKEQPSDEVCKSKDGRERVPLTPSRIL
jgi:hypothetical protein